MRAFRIASLFLIASALSTCVPADEERCGDGYFWDSEDKTCYEEVDTAATPDAGDAGDKDVVGLGDVCSQDGSECQGKEADFCAIQPGAPAGYCTIKNCSAEPDDCPAGYRCCVFSTDAIPDFCATQEQYDLMGSMCTG